MSETAEFDIGSDVACRDGVCGRLSRVVVDPVARAITHLAVEPSDRHSRGRLVPVEAVESTGGGVIRLKCTKPQFEVFELAEDTQLLSGDADHPGYPSEDVVALPYYGLRTDAAGFAGTPEHRISPHVKLHDRVPVGEVAVRRGEHVHATDGQIGRVRGLVIDPADHHVTHFLLDEGHLWGHKTVAIPIGAVTHIEDGVRLSLTKDEVRDLPPVDVDERTARA
jgi:sporulation protein YlmC with PRC-barrel domain